MDATGPHARHAQREGGVLPTASGLRIGVDGSPMHSLPGDSVCACDSLRLSYQLGSNRGMLDSIH